jgi:ribosomal protein S15
MALSLTWIKLCCLWSSYQVSRLSRFSTKSLTAAISIYFKLNICDQRTEMNRLPSRSTGVIFRRLLSTTPEVIPTKTPLSTKTPLKLLGLNVPYPKHIENAFSLATANQEEITAHRISLAIEKYKKHDSDTGSAIVQLAVMTEKIYNLARHFAMHKKDKAGGRGFQVRKRTERISQMSFDFLSGAIVFFL